ncbi:MAG TPA: glycosyltransferase family 39 protein [Abditibacteriaceae bacterium]|jgi:hypothetical protein
MNYLLDAAMFLGLVAFVAAGSWRMASRFAARASVAVALFGGFFGLAGTSIWLVGLVKLNAAICASIFAILLLALWLAPLKRTREYGRFRPYFETTDKILLAYVAGICALTFVLTLVPPTASDYDSLVYHLSTPAQWLRAGRVVELPYDHHSYFPLTTESLFAAALSWRGLDNGAVFAKLFHWLMLPLGCATLLAIGRRFVSTRAGVFAAALWASLPVVQSEASTAYIDLALVAFALLAVLCFLEWRETAGVRWLFACGAFCGFCLGTKYLGALIFGWLGLWILFVSLKEKRPLAHVGAGALVALILGGGWYARNWLLTGNPVFPFAYEIFGGRGWTQEMATAYANDQKGFGWGRSPLDLLLLPFRLVFTPLNVQNVGGKFVGLFETPGMLVYSVIGPALLAFGAPSVLLKNKPFVVKFCLATFAFLFVFWAATGQYLRYLLPAYALLCVACGWGIENFLRRSTLLKSAVGLCLILALAFAPVLTISHARGNFAVLSGGQTPDEYLRRTFGGYQAMNWAATNAPANARFAVWGEPRCYYLQRDYFLADDAHNNLIDYKQPLFSQLKKLGATHVLVNTQAERNGGFGAVPDQWNEIVTRGQATELSSASANGYVVYQLK